MGGAIKIVPIGELCSPASADAFVLGMGTAHMDAVLRGMQPAIDLLASDLHELLAAHDVKIEIVDAATASSLHLSERLYSEGRPVPMARAYAVLILRCASCHQDGQAAQQGIEVKAVRRRFLSHR